MYTIELTNEEQDLLSGLLRGANIPAQFVDVFISLRNKVSRDQMSTETKKGFRNEAPDAHPSNGATA